MPKQQQKVTHGYCRECGTLQDLQVSAADPDLLVNQGEVAAYLVGDHLNKKTGQRCAGVAVSPLSLYYPANSRVFNDSYDAGRIEDTEEHLDEAQQAWGDEFDPEGS